MSATPKTMLKSTTAGTTLLASEAKGFDGMYELTKSMGSRPSRSVVLKNEAVSMRGKISGKRKTAASARPQSASSSAPQRNASVFA